MDILDTYNDIISLTRQMNGVFDLSLWEQYIRRISSELWQKVTEDSKNYDYNRDILPVMTALINKPDKINEAHESFLTAVNGLDEKMQSVVGMELPVQLVFYIGLCNGAGWATRLDGKPTVLLGIEKIIELDWCDKETMSALIYHELGHIWHDAAGTLRRDTDNMRDKYVWQLFQEGIAMFFEQMLFGDFSYYHQNKNGWLNWCTANKNDLNAEYLRRLQSNESAQDFFGDWQNYKGYSDVGYYIGCEFVKFLRQKYSMDELANMEIDVVFYNLCKYVSKPEVVTE